MGIVNVTPDSFSDGGKFLTPAASVAQGLKLADQGAEILDIGGESTRPGAEPVDEAEELRRVVPVIEQLAARVKIPISVDTAKPAVARAALEAGASIVNDVAAGRRNAAMWELVSRYQAGYVMMHARGTPQTMQSEAVYDDVVGTVNDAFSGTLDALQRAGIAPAQVVLDPGIGFGKTLEHNLALLANIRSFARWERPLLIGVSRKSFLGKITGASVNERLHGSLACTILAVANGVHIVRTHDVPETRDAIRTAEAILSYNSNHVE